MVLCAKDVLDPDLRRYQRRRLLRQRIAFRVIYNRLLTQRDDELPCFSMVGYLIENTLTEHGSVNQGRMPDRRRFLTAIDERAPASKSMEIESNTREDDGKTWTKSEPGTIVSMNLWGFTQGILFPSWKPVSPLSRQALKENPLKGEYLLPRIVNDLVRE